MNQRSDIDRVMEAWMADGPTAIPDRVVDVVAARIGVQRQRRAWPFLRRTNDVTPLKLAAGLAAAIVVAVVGYSLLPKASSPVGPSTAPTASAQPSAVVSDAPVVDLPDGDLPGGRYRTQLSFISPSLSVVADIPAGWIGFPEYMAFTSTEGNNEGALITFMEVDGLFSDPCHWDLDGSGAIDQPGDVEVGPTVDDLVAALKANTAYTSSSATPVTLGQFEGQELELQLPGDAVPSTCDEQGPPFDGPAYFVFSGKGAGWYAQGPDNHWQLYIVDVEGTRLVTLLSYFDEVPQADVEAARAIVESFEITP